jgi:hypothetical protein
MQMIYSKMFVFPVFVCTLRKCSGKYFTWCVWSNVKQINRKYTHPKSPESTKNTPTASQPPKPTSQPTPQPTPQPTQTHPHKPTTTSASHPTTGKTTYTGTPTPITSNPELAKIKPKPQIW